VRRQHTDWFALNLAGIRDQDPRSVDDGLWVPQYNFNTSGFNYNYSNPSIPYEDDCLTTEYCFIPTKLRSEDAGVVEMSEIQFKDRNGSIVNFPEGTYATGTGEESSGSASSRGPGNVIDGNTSTKWVALFPAKVCIPALAPMNFSAFRFTTTDGRVGKDPIQWTLKRRMIDNCASYEDDLRNVTSTLLHVQSEDYPTPEFRKASTEWFDVDLMAVPFTEQEKQTWSDEDEDDYD
jgi:hypothetical protein